MHRRSLAAVLLSFIAILPFIESCETTCEVPSQPGLSSVRIIDAMAGVDTLRVFIDSVLFEQAYYHVADTNLYHQTSAGRLQYHNSFSGTGTALRVGQHHITAYSASDPRTALVDTILPLGGYRQSLVFIGKRGSSSTPTKLIYTNDVTRSVDVHKSLIRFIHTVTDLDTIDVYFWKTVRYGTDGKPKPDLRIGYGQISRQDGTGLGTGQLATDYFDIPSNDTGILITRARDTNEVVFYSPYGFNTNGFFATVIVRGETHPTGSEPIPTADAFADGSESVGTLIISIPTFALRLTNATREPRMSLLIKGNGDQVGRTDISLQQYVEYIKRDSTGRFFPLTMTYHSVADYFLSAADSGHVGDTTYSTNSLLHFPATVNRRYTFVAIDSASTGAPNKRLGIAVLTDSLSSPGGGKTRVRFFNASADHMANFTFGGTNFSLRQGQTAYADATLGTYDVPVSDGSTPGTLHFTLDSELPMTVFILPPNGGNQYPVAIAHN